ncbi:MAG: hypothetical protein CEE42_11445 [Promethearchaeota archaeon Loki_b31]|nr:MAG: hypothetical protein CEE42_11445 [Candidatus Lokiarchaeota archaeon Loki_b31]
MIFFELLEKLKTTDITLILYTLLNRIPIIVYGNNAEKIDDFLIDLSELIHFRKEFIFYTDFISNTEYHDLVMNENIDYNTQKIYIRCPTSVALKALNQFERFNSWLIGIEILEQKDKIRQFINSIKKKINCFLGIAFFSNSFSIELVGINWKLLDLQFEHTILQKISQDTEKSIIKMKRVLLGKIKSEEIDEDLVDVLLDFNREKEELKKNILKKEVQNFYLGSKRAFSILSRLNLLNNIEMKTQIGSKTLLETIDYEDAPIDRIISFINKEWGEDFSILIENGKKVNALDSMQSLWG